MKREANADFSAVFRVKDTMEIGSDALLRKATHLLKHRFNLFALHDFLGYLSPKFIGDKW